MPNDGHPAVISMLVAHPDNMIPESVHATIPHFDLRKEPMPTVSDEVFTRDEVQAIWLELGYTHVLTHAGEIPIPEWLRLHGDHGPDISHWRFNMRDDHAVVDGAVDQDPTGVSSKSFYRGVWRPLKRQPGNIVPA